MSVYLFILWSEILANKITHEKNINEIKIDKKTLKISLLADDLTLILKENVLQLLNSFSLYSGFKINIEKKSKA